MYSTTLKCLQIFILKLATLVSLSLFLIQNQDAFFVYFKSCNILYTYRNVPKPSMTSSLIKDSLIFNTDFVRKKSVENINMIVEPLKDPLASSIVYSPPFTSKALSQSPKHYGSMNSINSPTSPGFERFEPSCLSQSIKKVEFAPKSPNPTSETETFFRTPFVQLKTDSTKSSSNLSVSASSFTINEKRTLQTERETKCRAFWVRSNAVILAYHK